MNNLTVRVEFMNVLTGALFGVCDLPAEHLPEAFDSPTTLNIQEQDWKVVTAEPRTKQAFRKTGRLRLHLTKVATIDPSEILFSLPSVTKQLPMLDQIPSAGQRDLEIHEDDWRQIEFIGPAFESETKQCLDEIRRIHTEFWKRVGWTKMHIRDEIPHPLKGVTLLLEEFRAQFTIVKTLPGVRFEATHGHIIDSFAFTTWGGLTFYGRTEDGVIRELCMIAKKFDTPSSEVAAIKKIADSENLSIVNWCRLQLLKGNSSTFESEFAFCTL